MGLQLALAELWRSYGVVPDAVIGHSMGEVSAAVVAGALTVEQGLQVIAVRSALMSRQAGAGAVALLELDEQATGALLAQYRGVEVAGYLSPRQTVVAGVPDAVDAVIAAVAGQERFARRVNMEVASHTALMDPILAELRAQLAGLAPVAPQVRWYSTVVDPTGPTPALDADYWANNVRQPARVGQAIAAAGEKHGTFIEISPHPILTHTIDENLETVPHCTVATLVRNGDDTLTFHQHLNGAHPVSPRELPHPPEPHPVLPATPWRHTHHWLDVENSITAAESAPRPGTLLGPHINIGTTPAVHLHLTGAHPVSPRASPHPPDPHPVLPATPWRHTHHGLDVENSITAAESAPRPGTLLGTHINIGTTPPVQLWQARLAPETKPYPGSHRNNGVELVPASVLLQTLSEAASAVSGQPAVSDIRFEHPIVVDRPRTIQVVADGESVVLSSKAVASKSVAGDADARWVKHL